MSNNSKIIFVVAAVALVLITILLLFKPDSNDLSRDQFVSVNEIKSTDVIVRITSSGFEPLRIEIKKGQTVAFINKSGDYSWPASDLHPTHEIYPEFDPLEPMKNDEAWRFEFNKVGEWSFHDHLRSSRRGSVLVVE